MKLIEIVWFYLLAIL